MVSRSSVRVKIEKRLDSGLPEKYTTGLFEQKCGVLFQHVLEKYPDQGGVSLFGSWIDDPERDAPATVWGETPEAT